MNRKMLSLILLFLLIGTTCGCVNEGRKESSKNIFETVADDDDFDTFVEALIATDINKKLENETRLFTVFVPTDTAFLKLNSAYLSSLFSKDLSSLAKILNYHIVAETISSTNFSDDMQLKTVQGKYIDVDIENNNIYLDDAMVKTTDIKCSNGIIHIIDRVLDPKDNIVETLSGIQEFNILADALNHTGLDTILSEESKKFTVFAPTDTAFGNLDPIFLNNLLTNDSSNLTKILSVHVISDSIFSPDFTDNMVLVTNEGSNINIRIINRSFYVEETRVQIADIECSNGVIHIIDKVIIP